MPGLAEIRKEMYDFFPQVIRGTFKVVKDRDGMSLYSVSYFVLKGNPGLGVRL